MVAKDTLILPLDSITKAHSGSINFIKGNSPILFMLSEANDNLLFYSLKDKKLIKKTALQRRGKNSVGIGRASACFINYDTIVIATSDYQVSIIDSSGNLKFKKSFLREDLLVQPKIGTNIPAILTQNKLLIGSIPYIDTEKIENFKKAFCLTQVDLNTQAIFPLVKYPKTYQKGMYGINFTANYSYTYNPDENKIVWSFPIDDSLYVQDITKNTFKAYYSPSKYFSNIEPSKEKNMQDMAVYTKFFIQSNSYGPIYYDFYRKVYYRFAERGVDDQRFKENKRWKFNSVIILDENFQKLGETDISENATNIQCFVAPAGFYIYEYQENSEDTLMFVCYKLIKNEK